jgi:hypothetical protein
MRLHLAICCLLFGSSLSFGLVSECLVSPIENLILYLPLSFTVE